MYQIPPTPANPPPYPLYHQGDSCPICGRPVEFVQHSAPVQVGRDLVIGRGVATLLPCGHLAFAGPPGRKVRRG
jgi:hypothetical protein